MGTVRVTKQASAELTEAQLQQWFKRQCAEMAEESGTDQWCGNWNANSGLSIISQIFPDLAKVNAFLTKELEKNGDVLALRVGEFKSVWPVTKEQKALMARHEALSTELKEFEYRILERAKKQKSKTKKCTHCESSINVHKLQLPALKELDEVSDRFSGEYIVRQFGRVMFVNMAGLTDCPVCNKNLLRTETDVKNETSLKNRVSELHTKVRESQMAHAKALAGKPTPYWLVAADCGD
jgi:DNA repair exonuclease SbcCD ATPase subunit